MDEYGGGGGGLGIGFFLMMGVVGMLGLAMYVFISIAIKKICIKCGKEPGALVWVPILRVLPLMEVAGMQTWMIVLLFIPFANLVFFIMLLLGLSKARNKHPGIAIALWLFCFGPVGAFGFLGFSE